MTSDPAKVVHFRPKNQFDPRRKSPVVVCGKYYFDVQKWSEDWREVTCPACTAERET